MTYRQVRPSGLGFATKVHSSVREPLDVAGFGFCCFVNRRASVSMWYRSRVQRRGSGVNCDLVFPLIIQLQSTPTPSLFASRLDVGRLRPSAASLADRNVHNFAAGEWLPHG